MQCRVCDSEHLAPVVDLGQQPWCNHFLTPDEVGKEPFYPLRLMYCNHCSTSQLDYTVTKEIMFGNHTYLSGITKSLSQHFLDVATEIDTRFFAEMPDKSILDIGSNDGTFLKHCQQLGYDVLGIESSKTTATIANEAGIPTKQAFFNLEVMQQLDRQFDAFHASGVFFHLEELHSVCKAIKWGLKPNGVFTVQFLYMKSIMENLAFDQIYHEHLLYYTLKTIEVLLNRHGLEMFDARLAPIHGGSIIGFIGHRGARPVSTRLSSMRAEEEASGCNDISAYHRFAQNIEKMKRKNVEYLTNAKKAGKVIYGMGAPVKGNTMLNYFGIGPEIIPYLLEKNPLRDGLYSPGMHIPVIMEHNAPQQPDIYYVLAWNFKREILANNQHLIDQGIEFFFPVNPKEGSGSWQKAS